MGGTANPTALKSRHKATGIGVPADQIYPLQLRLLVTLRRNP